MILPEIILSIPFFAGLDPDEVARAGELVETQGYLAGTQLFAVGDTSDCFYVVVQGAVQVRIPASSEACEKEIDLKCGKLFGEMGVLSGLPRSGAAEVTENSILARIDRDAFDRLMAVDEPIATKVMAVYLARLNEIERTELAAEVAVRDAGLLLFYSAGSGAGASFLCANIALKIHDLTQKSVLVLDLDLETPTQHIYLGDGGQPGGLPALVAAGDFSAGAIREHAHKLHFGVDLLGGPNSPPLGQPTPSQALELIENAGTAYDFVMIDTTSFLTELNRALFSHVGFTHLVMGPDIITVSHSLGLVRRLESEGMADRFRLVLNKFQPHQDVTVELLEKKFARQVIGGIEFEHSMALDAANEGLPVVKRSPRATLTADLTRLARLLVSRLPVQPSPERLLSLWDLVS